MLLDQKASAWKWEVLLLQQNLGMEAYRESQENIGAIIERLVLFKYLMISVNVSFFLYFYFYLILNSCTEAPFNFVSFPFSRRFCFVESTVDALFISDAADEFGRAAGLCIVMISAK